MRALQPGGFNAPAALLTAGINPRILGAMGHDVTPPTGIPNALTVDVEDYHNILARDWLERDFPPTEAVVRNTEKLLGLFDHHQVSGTFFILGEVAEHYPTLIRRIAAAGHELGVHGYRHRQVFKLTPNLFRQEVAQAKARLEDLIGQPIQGHRAPAFSILPETAWAFDVLLEAGFRYDSSIMPIKARRYGWPGFNPTIHRMHLQGGDLIEAPLSFCSLGLCRLPACGGGYIRHFPSFFTRWAFRQVQRHRPAILYMHPYEIELCGPELDTNGLTPAAALRARRFHRLQIRNRRTVLPKITALLQRFAFAPLARVIEATLATGRDAEVTAARY